MEQVITVHKRTIFCLAMCISHPIIPIVRAAAIQWVSCERYRVNTYGRCGSDCSLAIHIDGPHQNKLVLQHNLMMQDPNYAVCGITTSQTKGLYTELCIYLCPSTCITTTAG